jgi:hypothetical protein
MTAFLASEDLDANSRTITSNQSFLAKKSVTMLAGTTGAIGASTLFTVTGDVLVTLWGVIGTSFASGGAATMSVGVASGTALFCAVTAVANLTAKKSWYLTNAPALTFLIGGSYSVGQSQNIIQTIADFTMTDGQITYYCLWRPVSTDGNVVAA